MHLRNKLNAKKVVNLTTPGVYSDGGGLYLRVRPTGTKSWLFICMMEGKRREIGLGSSLDVSLANARTKAAELRELQLADHDPAVARKQARVEAKPIPTFGEVATDLIEGIEGGFKNEKHRKQWRSTITTYAEPILKTQVDQVQATDIFALLQPIWLTKAETASRVRQRIERILDAATVRGHRSGDNPARLKGNLEFLLPRQAKGGESHHEALPYAAVPKFMAQLRDRPALAARMLEFAILTAARTSEVLGARWSEFDFERCIWEVPAERMADQAWNEALRILTGLVGGARHGGRNLRLVQALILKAAVHYNQGDGVKAVRAFLDAIAVARDRGLTQIFLDDAQLCRPLVSAALAGFEPGPAGQNRELDFLHSLQQRLGLECKIAKPDDDLHAPLEPLTAREKPMVDLLLAGLRNREIAGRLSMSEATVKWHLYILYSKLGVNNRTAAIHRARSLGLAAN